MEKKKFETYLDGICDLYQLDKRRKPVPLLKGIRFRNRVVGYKRNWEAEQAGHTVQRLIRIPRADMVEKGCFVVIQGKQYKVAQAQTIPDAFPQSTDLTLEQPDMLLSFDKEEAGAGGRV